MLFTAEHDDVRRSLQKFIATEINPFVDEWEKANIFPAQELFKKLGELGLKAHEYIIAETIEYTRNRKAFGQSILDNQVVHFKLAEMQTEVELLRSLIYSAAEQLVAGEDVTKLATMAKLRAGRLGRELTDACLQFWGGMGFMNETPVSRAYRDSRLTSIGGGADEVMLMVLCKMMGTLPNLKQK
jgi:citronellyl-CoA dehydrogenase